MGIVWGRHAGAAGAGRRGLGTVLTTGLIVAAVTLPIAWFSGWEMAQREAATVFPVGETASTFLPDSTIALDSVELIAERLRAAGLGAAVETPGSELPYVLSSLDNVSFVVVPIPASGGSDVLRFYTTFTRENAFTLDDVNAFNRANIGQAVVLEVRPATKVSFNLYLPAGGAGVPVETFDAFVTLWMAEHRRFRRHIGW